MANKTSPAETVSSERLLGHSPEEWLKLLGHKLTTGEDEKKATEEIIRAAMNQELQHAATLCRQYAHSGVNVYRRQVAYACERRILDAMWPNERTEPRTGRGKP